MTSKLAVLGALLTLALAALLRLIPRSPTASSATASFRRP